MKKSEFKFHKPTLNTVRTTVVDYVIIAVGAVLYALSVVVFTSPNNIAPGGLTGIATMLNFMFSLPIGTLIFLMNIPLFIWGAVENGLNFLTKTIIGTAFEAVDMVVEPVGGCLNRILMSRLYKYDAALEAPSTRFYILPWRLNRRNGHNCAEYPQAYAVYFNGQYHNDCGFCNSDYGVLCVQQC